MTDLSALTPQPSVAAGAAVLLAVPALDQPGRRRVQLVQPPGLGGVMAGADLSASAVIAQDGTALRTLAARAADVANARDFGAAGDGVTDDYPAFVRMRATGRGVLYFPATPYGYRFSQGIAPTAGSCIVGDPASPGAGQAPQGTVFLFDLSVPVCITLDGGAGCIAQGVRHVTVTRALVNGSMPVPPAGSVGVLVQSAYNVTLVDVTAMGHARGFRFYASPTGAGSNSNSINALQCCASACTDVYVEQDGWPEIRWIGGRLGGPHDCAGMRAVLRVTGGTATNSPMGMGPNTLGMVGTQCNPGYPPDYFVLWDAALGGGSTATIFRFSDLHVENIGLACFGSTTATASVSALRCSNVSFNVNCDLFALAPGTSLSLAHLVGVSTQSGLTLAPGPGAVIDQLVIGASSIGGDINLIGAGGSTARIDAICRGSLHVGGSWTGLGIAGQVWGSVSCTASGVIDIDVPPKAIIRNATAAAAGGASGPGSWIAGGDGATDWGMPFSGAWSGGRFATPGDAQAREMVLRGRIAVGAGGVILTADGAPENPSNTMLVPQHGACRLLFLVQATQAGQVDAQSVASWQFSAVAKRGLGAPTVVGTVGATITGGKILPDIADPAFSGGAMWVQLLPDDAGHGLMLQAWMPGNASTILVHARILSSEVVG